MSIHDPNTIDLKEHIQDRGRRLGYRLLGVSILFKRLGINDGQCDLGRSSIGTGDTDAFTVGVLLEGIAHDVIRFGEVASDAILIGNAPKFPWKHISDCGDNSVSIDAAILATAKAKKNGESHE